jgi:calcineurin-like phosphoesterase family protein
MNTYVVADSHFGHANIIKYCNRPFSSADEHDECLIKNWNAVVKQEDHIYHLGDYGLLPEVRALHIRRRLNGTIFFIEGNHDKTASKLRNVPGVFGWYDKVRSIRVDADEYFLSHYAHRVWNKSHHGVVHLYGHSHNTLPDDPNAHSMDVGIDATAARLAGLPSGRTPDLGTTKADDYRPISIEEVKAFMKTKIWQPVDHHGR